MAYEELTRLVENNSYTTLMKSHPFYAKLRADPRFSEFCKKIGIRL